MPHVRDVCGQHPFQKTVAAGNAKHCDKVGQKGSSSRDVALPLCNTLAPGLSVAVTLSTPRPSCSVLLLRVRLLGRGVPRVGHWHGVHRPLPRARGQRLFCGPHARAQGKGRPCSRDRSWICSRCGCSCSRRRWAARDAVGAGSPARVPGRPHQRRQQQQEGGSGSSGRQQPRSQAQAEAAHRAALPTLHPARHARPLCRPRPHDARWVLGVGAVMLGFAAATAAARVAC